MHFESSASIQAPPALVWEILVDGGKWPEWDPSCERIEGTIALGNKIKAYSKLSPGRAFPVKVAEYSVNTRMVWTGGMPFGLFKGVRTFTLEGQGTGTEFAMKEVFSGPMLKLIGKSITDMTEAFAQFAEGLKIRAEAQMPRN